MSLNDPLSNVLSHLTNSEKRGKQVCVLPLTSKLILEVLALLRHHHYIGEVTSVGEGVHTVYHVHLLGNLNACGPIKPRFSVTWAEIEKFEKRYLPAKGFGFLVLSTSQGLMIHDEAKEKKVGGKLLAYCY